VARSQVELKAPCAPDQPSGCNVPYHRCAFSIGGRSWCCGFDLHVSDQSRTAHSCAFLACVASDNSGGERKNVQEKVTRFLRAPFSQHKQQDKFCQVTCVIDLAILVTGYGNC
jgi:hypothetical protein